MRRNDKREEEKYSGPTNTNPEKYDNNRDRNRGENQPDQIDSRSF